jgi:uncharacterized protein YbbC (DUF1343 family)
MLRVIYTHHPKEVEWKASLDRLAGTDKLRTAIEQNSVDALIKEWREESEKFARMVDKYRIYK